MLMGITMIILKLIYFTLMNSLAKLRQEKNLGNIASKANYE
jgi:Na+/H+-dicarboxylate symporter